MEIRVFISIIIYCYVYRHSNIIDTYLSVFNKICIKRKIKPMII